jgi:stage 0 sporulation protein B (sporulation initiation phosphotransferase)
MKADEVMNMLRHYRHDVLNDIQLIHGYAALGNMEKIKEKINEMIVKSNEERKLTNLKCPHFTLWVINFNHAYENLRLSYKIQELQNDLSQNDLFLYATCEEMIQLLHNYILKEKIYKVELQISNGPNVELQVNGPIVNKDELQKKLDNNSRIKNIQVEENFCKIYLSL